MTRINLVPPLELYDQHLMAEYREIQHVPMSLNRSLKKKGGFKMEEIPSHFTLNTGHVKFFYNKGRYLLLRFGDIVHELKRRGFNIKTKEFRFELFPDGFQEDWLPTEDDFKAIRIRIAEKVNLKPNWYKKTPHISIK